MRLRDLIRKLNSKLRGYYRYYGVIGNAKSLWEFDMHVVQMLHKWLSRRSQRAKLSWKRFQTQMKWHGLVRPSINEVWTRREFRVVRLY